MDVDFTSAHMCVFALLSGLSVHLGLSPSLSSAQHMVIAYLSTRVKARSMSLEEALSAVRAVRPTAHPKL